MSPQYREGIFRSFNNEKSSQVSLIFLMIDSVFGINFLLVKGYDKILRNITIVSSIIGFVLAFPLVKYYEAIGVAVVYTFTSCLIGVGTMVYAYKMNKIK